MFWKILSFVGYIGWGGRLYVCVTMLIYQYRSSPCRQQNFIFYFFFSPIKTNHLGFKDYFFYFPSNALVTYLRNDYENRSVNNNKWKQIKILLNNHMKWFWIMNISIIVCTNVKGVTIIMCFLYFILRIS